MVKSNCAEPQVAVGKSAGVVGMVWDALGLGELGETRSELIYLVL